MSEQSTGAGLADDGVLKKLLKRQEESTLDILGNTDADDLEPLENDVRKMEQKMLKHEGSIVGKLFVDEKEEEDAQLKKAIKDGYVKKLSKGVYEFFK